MHVVQPADTLVSASKLPDKPIAVTIKPKIRRLSKMKKKKHFAREYPNTSLRVDPATKLPNHIQLAIDIPGMSIRSDLECGALITVEILDHNLVRNIFLASGSGPTDHLLRSISDRLKKLLTRSSKLYCVGVGRYAILTPRHPLEIEHLLGSIQEIMGRPFSAGNFRRKMDIVMGSLPISLALEAPSDALRKATAAIQEAREKNLPTCPYHLEYDAIQIRKHRILQDIPEAISRNQFYLSFQPKIDALGTVTGAETLLRWKHPNLGSISPGEFIPLADDTELMVEITKWVTEEAVRVLNMLSDSNIKLHLAINVSSRNLDDEKFADNLIKLLEDAQVSPSDFQIECTEYSALKSSRCLHSLNKLSSAGFSIALDDFGNGYSNIASLQNLPIDLLKIDKSLISPIEKSKHSLQLLDGVIKLGKSLGYRIAAEGVESTGVRKLLEKMDIDEMQGYEIAKPMDYESLINFIHGSMPPQLQLQPQC